MLTGPHATRRTMIRLVILSFCAAVLPAACDAGRDPTAPAPALRASVTGSATGDPIIGDVFEFAEFALYVPASPTIVRGVLIALGGPDTRAFATGKRFGAPMPAVEASLQLLGQGFRTMASSHGLAVLGTSRAAMANGPASDQLLRAAVETAAVRSGRPELPFTPMLMYGLSGGAPQASGFTARNPESVAGLFLKVPASVSSLTSGDALRVPTYVVLAELDVFVNNATLTAAFESNRRAGAIWALAKELGVPHHSLSSVQREVTLNWMRTVLERRLLPVHAQGPLRKMVEPTGWLGDRATGEAAPWAKYAGDRASASWLPSESAAMEWEALVAPPTITVSQSPTP